MPAESIFFVLAVVAVFMTAIGAIAYAQSTSKD
jgi:hypothetical protein